jgi:hypothetical protein
MSYLYEKLIPNENHPSDITVIFRKNAETEYGVEWPASRFEIPASDLVKNPPRFVKLVKRPAPEAVDTAIEALKEHFADADTAPDYLAEITAAPVDRVVVPLRKVA